MTPNPLQLAVATAVRLAIADTYKPLPSPARVQQSDKQLLQIGQTAYVFREHGVDLKAEILDFLENDHVRLSGEPFWVWEALEAVDSDADEPPYFDVPLSSVGGVVEGLGQYTVDFAVGERVWDKSKLRVGTVLDNTTSIAPNWSKHVRSILVRWDDVSLLEDRYERFVEKCLRRLSDPKTGEMIEEALALAEREVRRLTKLSAEQDNASAGWNTVPAPKDRPIRGLYKDGVFVVEWREQIGSFRIVATMEPCHAPVRWRESKL